MAASVKTDDQKRIDKLEELVGKLIKTNKQLMKESDVQKRILNRTRVKVESLEANIRRLSSN